MTKISLFLVMSFLALVSFAQNQSNLDGKYYGKFENGGFEDSIIIEGNSLVHALNKAWGYGVEHRYIYTIVDLEDGLLKFEQIGYLRDLVDAFSTLEKGNLGREQFRIVKLDNGDIQFISESHPNNPRTFRRISE